MADWNGFKKNGTTYIPNDATARASISTIEGKIPNGTTSSNPLVNQSTMETALDGKADVGDVTSLSESVSDIEDKIPSNASSSNQLATRSEVSAAYKPKGNATLATLPPLTTANLNNVYNMTEDFTTTADFAEGAGISVKAGNEVGIINIAKDPDALIIKYTVLGGFIDLSEYATQASVISALANKVDKVTGKGLSANDYDNTAKAVVTTAQDNIIANTKLIKDTVGWSGKNKYLTTGGVRGVIQSDGTLDTSGAYATDYYTSPYVPVSKNQIMTFASKTGQAIYRTAFYDSSKTFISRPYDTISNKLIELPNNAAYMRISVEDNANAYFTNLMCRDADILDDTYEEGFGSTAFPRSEQAVLGAKNINGTKYVSQTSSSVVWTANDDGSITAVSGTATGNNGEIGAGINDAFVAPFTAQVKIIGGLSSDIYLYPYDYTDSARPYKDATKTGRLTISDNQWGDTPLEFYMIKGHKYVIAGRVLLHVTANNDTMYPRLLLASDTDPIYQPYAMTNKELTEKHEIKDVTFTAGTGIDVRPATFVKIEDKLLVGYFALKNDTENAMPINTVLATISGVPIHHGANWVLPAVITDNMSNTAVMITHDMTSNTLIFKNQSSLPAGNTITFSLTEYMIKA